MLIIPTIYVIDIAGLTLVAVTVLLARRYSVRPPTLLTVGILAAILAASAAAGFALGYATVGSYDPLLLQ